MNGLDTQLLRKLKLNLMFRTFLIILVTFLYTSILKAEVVSKIEIAGNSRVSDETIKIYGNIRVNRDILEQDINKILNNLLSLVVSRFVLMN